MHALDYKDRQKDTKGLPKGRRELAYLQPVAMGPGKHDKSLKSTIRYPSGYDTFAELLSVEAMISQVASLVAKTNTILSTQNFPRSAPSTKVWWISTLFDLKHRIRSIYHYWRMLELDISELPNGELGNEEVVVVDLSSQGLKMRWRTMTMRLWELNDELDRVEHVGVAMGLGMVRGWVYGQFGSDYEEFTIGKGLLLAEQVEIGAQVEASCL